MQHVVLAVCSIAHRTDPSLLGDGDPGFLKRDGGGEEVVRQFEIEVPKEKEKEKKKTTVKIIF